MGRPWRVTLFVGMKHVGKSALAKAVAGVCDCEFVDTDDLVVRRYQAAQPTDGGSGETRPCTCRDIVARLGVAQFRRIEAASLAEFQQMVEPATPDGRCYVIALGGGAADNAEVMALLSATRHPVVHITDAADRIFARIAAGGLPHYLQTADPRAAFDAVFARRERGYRAVADITFDVAGRGLAAAATALAGTLVDYRGG